MSKVIIDVRESEEFTSGHAEGAINVPLSSFQTTLQNGFPAKKDDEVILYCRSGSRAAVAKVVLEAKDYKNVVNAINIKGVETYNK